MGDWNIFLWIVYLERVSEGKERAEMQREINT
jgi:hypothetical protein